MIKLTSEQLEKYVDGGGTSCPNCESTDISMASRNTIDSDDVYMWREAECEGCGAKWVDEYKLVNALQPPHWFFTSDDK